MTPHSNPLKGKTVYQVLQEISSNRSRKKKIELLHQYKCVALMALCDYAFNPKLKWLLPEGNPEFNLTKELPQNTWARLQQFYKKIQYLLDIPPHNKMHQMKREQIYVNLLESIHPDDTKVVMALKDRKLPFDNLTKELIEEAYPELKAFWEK